MKPAPIPPTEFWWLIFDIETRSFLAPGHAGFGVTREEAGRYTWAQAVEMLELWNPAILPVVTLLPDL
jgi:hypothetical protein